MKKTFFFATILACVLSACESKLVEEVHLVDTFFQFIYRPEVTATIEHQATIAIKRFVLDVQYW